MAPNRYLLHLFYLLLLRYKWNMYYVYICICIFVCCICICVWCMQMWLMLLSDMYTQWVEEAWARWRLRRQHDRWLVGDCWAEPMCRWRSHVALLTEPRKQLRIRSRRHDGFHCRTTWRLTIAGANNRTRSTQQTSRRRRRRMTRVWRRTLTASKVAVVQYLHTHTHTHSSMSTTDVIAVKHII